LYIFQKTRFGDKDPPIAGDAVPHCRNGRVATGEILAFLGPNGAGKTTTMKILTNFISADEGEVYMDKSCNLFGKYGQTEE